MQKAYCCKLLSRASATPFMIALSLSGGTRLRHGCLKDNRPPPHHHSCAAGALRMRQTCHAAEAAQSQDLCAQSAEETDGALRAQDEETKRNMGLFFFNRADAEQLIEKAPSACQTCMIAGIKHSTCTVQQ